ncbi:MAG: hypothetical protein UY37_C0014G0008 [Candidatus Beckwithbacteria bacterium GW2011_GWC2_49_11]|nr:MAG: hypothetical protein UY37_C0014G0008 [Candidatus Beckwithbacteria bacterium GW2011_GWC2_49_11]
MIVDIETRTAAKGASEVALLGAKSGLLRRREMTKWLRRRVKMVEEKL